MSDINQIHETISELLCLKICKARGRPCKIFLTSSLITMQNFVNVYHAVCACVGDLRPLGWGRGWPHKTRASPTCLIPDQIWSQ